MTCSKCVTQAAYDQRFKLNTTLKKKKVTNWSVIIEVHRQTPLEHDEGEMVVYGDLIGIHSPQVDRYVHFSGPIFVYGSH